jgi:rhodanese-related sulfurtransferase
MAPFVPEIISDQLNLIVALLLGIAFGFVLEQAGFSSSRRLAGVFYGYDFTVVRVFFTAAVTAMSGIILLGYLGLLDLSLIYVNPLWLKPAIIGGMIMGVGFILGGYCPGTSICAVAIGKVDAMIFVLGGLVGVFGFAELYPSLASFCESSAAGAVKVYDSLGIGRGLFAGLLTFAAVGMFAATTLIERRVSKTGAPSLAFSAKSHRKAAIFAIVLAVILLILPDRQARLLAQAEHENQANAIVRGVSPDELAFWIVSDDIRYKIIDLRSPESFKAQALPNSVNEPIGDLFGKEAQSLFGQRDVHKILVAGSEREERIAYLLMKGLGFENMSVLTGGLPEFETDILKFNGVSRAGDRWDADIVQFRTEAKAEILKRIEVARQTPTGTVKKAKAVKGGC